MFSPIAGVLLLASTLTGGTDISTTAAKPNLRACYDGTCKLTITRAVSFRVSSRFGITRLSISFTSQSVRVKGTGPGVTSQAMFTRGASGSVNGIRIRAASLTSGKAVLRLTAGR